MHTKNKGGRPATPNKPWTPALSEGKLLATLRETYNYRKGLPGEMRQSELALKSGLSRSVIANSEQGNRPMTNRTIKMLAVALEVDPREIRFSYQTELELTGVAA
ncbi:XRE family transcriptional regulator [Arthrobacter frigidicola]|nr:XRE family transcriptional regulator [Arthrobacter frigidicola]